MYKLPAAEGSRLPNAPYGWKGDYIRINPRQSVLSNLLREKRDSTGFRSNVYQDFQDKRNEFFELAR